MPASNLKQRAYTFADLKTPDARVGYCYLNFCTDLLTTTWPLSRPVHITKVMAIHKCQVNALLHSRIVAASRC